MSYSTECLFAGGNRHASAADWSGDILAYGSGNNVAIWSPGSGVHALLSGHTAAVNTVRFRGTDIITGGADNTVRIWRPGPWRQVSCLTSHTGSVNTIAVLGDLFVSGAADGTVKLWNDDDLIQTITLQPRFFPLTTALVQLDDGLIALAVAGTTTTLQIYTGTQELRLDATLVGHEGWIRSLDFVHQGGDVLLASASQDRYIRLWRFHRGPELPAIRNVEPEVQMANKAYYIGPYSVTFEALLVGHEDWIYSARWQGERLLTASADNSLSIWQESDGLWISTARLGEMSATKGATSATGSTGGFWNGLWSPCGRQVVSLGRTGSWRRWSYDDESDDWIQQLGVSGHVKSVKAVAWMDSCLLSTSSDQTTRLWAPWQGSWYEMTRPQIHGYDLNCLDTLPDRRFVSGADEKLLRVFDQPRGVARLLAGLAGVVDEATDLPDAANVPVLGLSNKATEDDADAPDMPVDRPPFEDQLARHTLWPEHEKLYGHGYEVSAVACAHDGSIVATACKASSLEHAVIRLYETKEWREVKPVLTAHALTVTSLAFSADDRYLLSVGRDRQWAVFERRDGVYSLLHACPKAHSRMILDCAWGHGVFATAGRDKTVKLWVMEQCVASITFDSAVTAVAIDHAGVEANTLQLATGLEDGEIVISEIDVSSWQVGQRIVIEEHDRPSAAISKLVWKPVSVGQERLLAACSDDCSIRVYRVR